MQWLDTSSIPKPRIPKSISLWHRPGDISKAFCPCHNCYTISPCTVRLNCSTASQSMTSIHFLRFIFLAGLFDLFAMTLSVSRASSGIDGCLDTDHQHTDVSHTLWVFENLMSTHRHSNWLVKFEEGCCKTWAYQWISGKHQVSGRPVFFKHDWRDVLAKKAKQIVIWKSTWTHSRGLCSHICSDFLDYSPSYGIHLWSYMQQQIVLGS